MGVLTIVEHIFRQRTSFFAEVKANQAVGRKLRLMAIVTAACLAIFGLILGIPQGIVQSLVSAVKLPLLYALALLISFPAFYYFALFAGSRLSFAQTFTLVLTAALVAAVLNLSLAPVSVFFWVSAPNYLTFKLINLGIMAASGVLGVVFLFQGSAMAQDDVPRRPRLAILWVWAVIFALVGTQLAWTLRPFIGSPHVSFQLFRAVGGSFFADLARSLVALAVSLLHPA